MIALLVKVLRGLAPLVRSEETADAALDDPGREDAEASDEHWPVSRGPVPASGVRPVHDCYRAPSRAVRCRQSCSTIAYHYMDLVPKGRDEDVPDAADRVDRRDEYPD